MRSDIIDVTVQLRRETEKAVQVSDGGDAVWLPRSQIEIEPSEDGKTLIVTMPEWLASEKGLV